MSDVPAVETAGDSEVEEGEPFGGAECEESSPEAPPQEDMDQGEEQLYPFDSLAVEFYEDPEDGKETKEAEVNDDRNPDEASATPDSASNETNETLEDDKNGTENSLDQNITSDSVASDVFEPSVVIKEEPADTDDKDLKKTYIEDFIYSNTSSFDEGSNSNFDDTREETKGSPLSRFPKIARFVEIAEYETLQVLYQLIYQRSAWDTQEILMQRILDFSGFTFSQSSEDFYNREFMLKTQPNEVLMKIGAILGLDQVQKMLANLDKGRPELITAIMQFLSRPTKRTRTVKTLLTKEDIVKCTSSNCGCRSRCFGRFTSAQKIRLLEYVKELDSKKLLDSYLVSLMECKRIIRNSLPQEDCKKLKEVYYVYRCKFGKKESIVCKSAFTTLHGIKLGRVNQLQNKMKSGKKLPPKMDHSDFPPISTDENEFPDEPSTTPVFVSRSTPDKNVKKTWVSSEEQIRKMEEELKESIKNKDALTPKVIVEKFDVKSIDSINNKLKEEAEKKLKEAEKAKEENSGKETPKLKDYSLVLQGIENASEELLVDVHFLLFLCTADAADKVKSSILEFSGFTFEPDTEEYDERNEFLQRMSFRMVSDVARSFSLATLSTKELTIKNILTFLTKPDESFLKVAATLPCSLSDVELDDFGDMSDSDVSITCEVVEKKVECIDLLSSGEDSDGEGKPRKEKKSTPQKSVVPPKVTTPANTPAPIVVQPTVVPPVPAPPVVQSTPDSQSGSSAGGIRKLKNFETICKIVNTHPHEYLIDIYDLLYLKKHEPSTLRSDILDFTGFTFEKGSIDYVKRKQLLDRMLYNSVRRIYNTLIHNTTEVKVFSKPTMITEIFQFLFKLPDHDTSVRPPPAAKAVPKPAFLQAAPVVKTVPPGLAGVAPPTCLNLPNQTGKLSDLKRVFQRVACFPCEYLIDVHKLLFMTDCDAKVIRQNIFAFKGFPFSEDSQDFQQRKMYLEYLTFHSLRKISSVLTTRSVDLRNSTKHELATHLTQVLAEYCNMDAAETATTSAAESTPATSTPAVSSSTSLISSSAAVENIVVTPSLPSFTNSSTTAESSQSVVISSVSSVSVEKDPPLSISIVDARSVNSPAVTTTTSTRGRRKRKTTPNKQTVSPSSEAQSQFADINLPEVEQYRQLYGQNLNIYNPNMPTITGIATFNAGGVQTFPRVTGPAMSFPVVNAYSQPIQVSSTFQGIQPPRQLIRMPQTISPTIVTQVPSKQTEIIVPGECLVSEPEEPPSKKNKVVSSPKEKNANKLTSSPDETNSFHNKLNYAMNTEDDEDCDKPLSSLVGHPIDSVLKKHIIDIVEQTDLASITINGVIQKIFNMYPKFDLSYRKEFIKSTLRSMLYRLGEQKDKAEKRDTDSPDCSVTTTDNCDNGLSGSLKATMECS